MAIRKNKKVGFPSLQVTTRAPEKNVITYKIYFSNCVRRAALGKFGRVSGWFIKGHALNLDKALQEVTVLQISVNYLIGNLVPVAY